MNYDPAQERFEMHYEGFDRHPNTYGATLDLAAKDEKSALNEAVEFLEKNKHALPKQTRVSVHKILCLDVTDLNIGQKVSWTSS